MELFAYERLNLKRNPFGEPGDSERASLAVLDVFRYETLLRQGGWVIQFIGECGRGKSTHLRALHSRFPGAPFRYIGEGERPRLEPRPLWFIDETQRLSRWRRHALFRGCESMAIGTHEDHSLAIRRAGKRVEVVEVGGVTHETLREILERRVEWARRGPGPVPWFAPEDIENLIERFGDDIRSIEGYLYEVVQRMEAMGRVLVPKP